MLRQLKWMASWLATIILLAATVFSAGAAVPRAASVRAAGRAGVAAPAAACTRLRASDVVWVTLTEDGDIDEEVDQYQAGTTTITPVFEYTCIPKRVTIVSVFYLGGDVVFTDKETLKATNSKGLYSYPLGTTDGTPMDEGEWTVEFYNDKTLLASGTVRIGESGSEAGNTVAVEGTVTDKKTRKPIKNAVVLVFVPGTTVKGWLERGQEQDEVYTVGKTDSKGNFVLENPVARGTVVSLLITAKGYKPLGTDNFRVAEDDNDPVVLSVQMTR